MDFAPTAKVSAPRRLRAELDALQELLDLPQEVAPSDPALLSRRVLEANQELCERIRQGPAAAGPWRPRVLSHVRAAVEEKLCQPFLPSRRMKNRIDSARMSA